MPHTIIITNPMKLKLQEFMLREELLFKCGTTLHPCDSLVREIHFDAVEFVVKQPLRRVKRGVDH